MPPVPEGIPGARRVLILNGPNLNLLGTREPHVYGRETLEDIAARAHAYGARLGLAVSFMQSNHEGVLVDAVHQARGQARGLIVNAGALTHTSVALLDALRAVALPTVEVHLSNIHQRESYRQHSYIAQVARGMIAGFGGDGYCLALEALVRLMERESVQS